MTRAGSWRRSRTRSPSTRSLPRHARPLSRPACRSMRSMKRSSPPTFCTRSTTRLASNTEVGTPCSRRSIPLLIAWRVWQWSRSCRSRPLSLPSRLSHRYGFNSSLFWAEEVVIYSIICMSFVGASMGVRYGSHISVDVLNAIAPPAINRWLHIVAALLGIAFAGFMVFYGFYLFFNTLGRGQLTAALRLPMARFYPCDRSVRHPADPEIYPGHLPGVGKATGESCRGVGGRSRQARVTRFEQ